MQEILQIMEEAQERMRQVANKIDTMHGYRIYLLNENAGIEAAKSFFASEDADATEIASSLHEACSDTFKSYELWRGKKRLPSLHQPPKLNTPLKLEVAVQKHQDAIVDLEEKLQIAFACVNRSRKLLDAYARLRLQ